ncbi:MAG: caspase family protein [Tildeniella nuda ZEHNDER 1965/U140]|jgi:hypothetical protein|nr:caspase family protein [Tildeniella nuda ZEHNDER 1965/U140]
MRQWAISVGINQYQFFQPLSYAQQDAQAIQRFLITEVGIPAEQCLLLTETSPPQWGKSTYPDRQTIQSWLDLLMQRYMQPGDALWFFFSGYGVCQQGQDYLVPIEGNPAAIQPTAIPLESIFRSLRQVSTEKVLVLLDANRNESSFSYETVGTHTEHLARITGIPTMLSCQPEEFSRETSALGHGFFTAALLESLRDHHCTTVGALGQYLSRTVPALGEHYWRPLQHPVTICPAEKLQQPLVLPVSAVAMHSGDDGDRPIGGHRATPQTTANGTVSTASQTPSNAGTPDRSGTTNGNGGWHFASTTAVVEPTQRSPFTSNGGTINTNGGSIAPSGENSGAHAVYPSYGNPGSSNGSTNGSTQSANVTTHPSNGTSAHTQPNGFKTHSPIDSAPKNHENGVAQSTPAAVPQLYSDDPEDTNDSSDALFWQPVLRWGSFVVVGLILGVLLRNCASFTPKTSTVAPQAANGMKQAGSGQVPTSTTPPDVKPSDARPSDARPSDAATIVPVVPSAAPAVNALSPQPIATTQSFGVSGASRINLSASAGAAATPRPAQPTVATRTLQPPVQSHLAKARALAAVNSDQASPYWFAIQEASKVQRGQPDYAQAKQEIALWSRQIMSIANQRGRQSSFDAAIVAARLVPQDQPRYAEAKGAIARWCPSLKRQRVANPVQRQQAKTTCRSLS